MLLSKMISRGSYNAHVVDLECCGCRFDLLAIKKKSRRHFGVVDLTLMKMQRASAHALRNLPLQVKLSIGFYLSISSALSWRKIFDILLR